MTADVIPLPKRPDYLSEVQNGIELLKKFNNTGGHNQMTISLILEKMADDLANAQGQKRR
ncbi:hypothetical protein ACQK5W_04125 [Pantoea sp. FN060301]|uniref:hypothetical protein n=1 Tax=Pantoea sp. FN060301 TaxID=3420380 RepID=UPI003D17BDCB